MSTTEQDYEKDKLVARDADPAVRRKLAARTDVRPEILYYLVQDAVPEVRRTIAANEATPHQADQLLARDRDESVRGELAQKVARLLPGLPPGAQAEARQRVIETLEILGRDEAAHVRELVAEAVKSVPDAPPDLIKRLARDAELAVASPVLRFSPLLTDQDLLEIISASPGTGRLSAIAGRNGLGAVVSDAIVAADDEPAVTALLANASAQIREETLDLIVERAPARTAWHEPLVRRPALPAKAATKIAGFIASSLLDVLSNRRDLPSDTRAKIANAVTLRLATEKAPAKGIEPARRAAGAEDDGESAEDKVRRLKKAGKLTEDSVADAVDEGQRAFARAALIVMSELRPAVVDKILSARSAKGVTALAWKAGLSMRLAVQLQTRLGGVNPRQALHPRGGKDFPMNEEELKWQIEFFGG